MRGVNNLALKAVAGPDDLLEDMLYYPRWVARPIAHSGADYPVHAQRLLIVAPSREWGEAVVRLCHHKYEPRIVYLGSQTRRVDDASWEIDVTDRQVWQMQPELLGEPEIIYYLGGITSKPIAIDDLDALALSQERGVLSLFRMLEAMRHRGLLERPLEVRVVTNDVFVVTQDGERGHAQPFAASQYGFIKALEKEYIHLRVRCIDLSLGDLPAEVDEEALCHLIRPVMTEAGQNGEDIAIRNGRRYTRELTRVRLAHFADTLLKQRGVYLILGGAGGIGLVLARYLARTYRACLLLLGRSELSDRQQAALGGDRGAGWRGAVHPGGCNGYGKHAGSGRPGKAAVWSHRRRDPLGHRAA